MFAKYLSGVFINGSKSPDPTNKYEDMKSHLSCSPDPTTKLQILNVQKLQMPSPFTLVLVAF